MTPQITVEEPMGHTLNAQALSSWYRVVAADGSTIAYAPDSDGAHRIRRALEGGDDPLAGVKDLLRRVRNQHRDLHDCKHWAHAPCPLMREVEQFLGLRCEG